MLKKKLPVAGGCILTGKQRVVETLLQKGQMLTQKDV